jgi:hypothetical protein
LKEALKNREDLFVFTEEKIGGFEHVSGDIQAVNAAEHTAQDSHFRFS